MHVTMHMDGFSAILPPSGWVELMLSKARLLTSAAGFVMGEVVCVSLAGVISALVAVGLEWILGSLTNDTLMVFSILVFAFVFVMAVSGAIWGRKLAQWMFDRVRAWGEAQKAPLEVRGHHLRIGHQYIDLADIVGIEDQRRSVSLVLRDGRRCRLSASWDPEVRAWLVAALEAVLQRRDAGSPQDVPEDLRAFQAAHQRE